MKRYISLLCLSVASYAHAAETDQYMTWTVELQDSAPVLNAYLNEQAEEFVQKMNARKRKTETVEELAQEYYFHLFQWLAAAPVRTFLWKDESVDRHPDNDVNFLEYQQQSIFRKPAFPFVLPMARTVRLGDVYLGIDKVGHFFGFGRRYYWRYVQMRAEGVPVEDAMRRVVTVGIRQENSLVGGLMDGIYSHADLEANFQGFLMLRSLAENGHFVREDEQWKLAKPIDILPFITPDLDESWNVSHFQRLRKKVVLPVLKEFCELRDHPMVQARFANYAKHEPSFSKKVIAEFFMETRGRHPQQIQSLDKVCAECQSGTTSVAQVRSQTASATVSR